MTQVINLIRYDATYAPLLCGTSAILELSVLNYYHSSFDLISPASHLSEDSEQRGTKENGVQKCLKFIKETSTYPLSLNSYELENLLHAHNICMIFLFQSLVHYLT